MASPVPSQLRDLRARLHRSNDFSSSLLALYLESKPAPSPQQQPQPLARRDHIGAFRCALPGATDALLAASHAQSVERVELLLRFIWFATASMRPGMRCAMGTPQDEDGETTGRPLAQWERKLLAHLSRTSALPDSAASLSGLLLVRLGRRARRAQGGIGPSGGGVRELTHAVALLRNFAASGNRSCADLVRLGAIPELVYLLDIRHASVSGPAAALLLTLVAEGQSTAAASDALANENFFLVASRALKAGLSSEGDDSLAACLCVILQRLSTRTASRPLYETGDLRGTLLALVHSGKSDFVLANAKSILSNTSGIV